MWSDLHADRFAQERSPEQVTDCTLESLCSRIEQTEQYILPLHSIPLRAKPRINIPSLRFVILAERDIFSCVSENVPMKK